MNTSAILNAYKECALWSSDIDGLTIYAIDGATAAAMTANVETFLQVARDPLERSELTDEQIGHSLWLTQHHHGAGFFDYSIDQDIIDALSSAAHSLKEMEIYEEDGTVKNVYSVDPAPYGWDQL
jgi:hypothetical protein